VNIYESERLLSEYLLFHYGSAVEVAPPLLAREALDYAVRCVTECIDITALPERPRGLDLGCAVGRSSFELACFCTSVVGIDFSQRFIDAAETIRRDGALPYARTDEGALTTCLTALAPEGVDRTRISFERGDAMDLRGDLGDFDVVLAANLVDRLSDPSKFLERLPQLVRPGGQLILTTPGTWLEDFTPRERWLGGFEREGMRVSTLMGLRAALDSTFTQTGVRDLPFLIREHSRKFQLSVAQASTWRRVSE
jgi:putative 4-mercaptohistidine N1-methyltranferase